MLLQTNSYIVPKERRAEHARLLRRFRQVLLRLGCELFEVYEQMGTNWTSGDGSGRFVQIMRFRDRKHQREVHAAEQSDPAAQELIAEFCDLVNLPYQQQQGLLAIGYYNGVIDVPAATIARAAEAPTVAAAPLARKRARSETAAQRSFGFGVPPPAADVMPTAAAALGFGGGLAMPARDEEEAAAEEEASVDEASGATDELATADETADAYGEEAVGAESEAAPADQFPADEEVEELALEEPTEELADQPAEAVVSTTAGHVDHEDTGEIDLESADFVDEGPFAAEPEELQPAEATDQEEPHEYASPLVDESWETEPTAVEALSPVEVTEESAEASLVPTEEQLLGELDLSEVTEPLSELPAEELSLDDSPLAEGNELTAAEVTEAADEALPGDVQETTTGELLGGLEEPALSEESAAVAASDAGDALASLAEEPIADAGAELLTPGDLDFLDSPTGTNDLSLAEATPEATAPDTLAPLETIGEPPLGTDEQPFGSEAELGEAFAIGHGASPESEKASAESEPVAAGDTELDLNWAEATSDEGTAGGEALANPEFTTADEVEPSALEETDATESGEFTGDSTPAFGEPASADVDLADEPPASVAGDADTTDRIFGLEAGSSGLTGLADATGDGFAPRAAGFANGSHEPASEGLIAPAATVGEAPIEDATEDAETEVDLPVNLMSEDGEVEILYEEFPEAYDDGSAGTSAGDDEIEAALNEALRD